MPDMNRDEAEMLLSVLLSRQRTVMSSYGKAAIAARDRRDDAFNAVIDAMTREAPPGWKRELVHKTIAKTLRSHRLQHSVDRDGEHYPLLDALTPDGETVAVGQQEIELLTDAIYLELLAAAPEAP